MSPESPSTGPQDYPRPTCLLHRDESAVGTPSAPLMVAERRPQCGRSSPISQRSLDRYVTGPGADEPPAQWSASSTRSRWVPASRHVLDCVPTVSWWRRRAPPR